MIRIALIIPAVAFAVLVGVTLCAAEPTSKTHIYKRVDDCELKLYVTRPAGWQQSDRRPAIVFFHGGGWVTGKPGQFTAHSNYFASRGMVAVQVEYRLLDRDANDPPEVCVHDAKSAMRWIRSRAGMLGIDPTRIASSGGSAGGHLAACVGMVDGLNDPSDDLSISASSNAMVLFNPVFDNGPGGPGSNRIGDRYHEFSPFHNVSDDDPPAIIFFGTQDRFISVRTAKDFVAAMEKVGVRCELMLFPGEQHGFFNYGLHENRPYYRTMAAADKFLASLNWLSGPPTLQPIESLPTFVGSTQGTHREIAIPTVDISDQTYRHAFVARGTDRDYHGHCDTVLLPDGQTMFAAWTVDHAQLVGPLARSEDGGKTWSAPLDVPANWHDTANTPAIHRLVAPDGVPRLIVFADGLDWRRGGKPPFPMHQAVSEDDGKTWTPMNPNGIQGEVPPKSILSFDAGKRLVMWTDLPGYVVQSESGDGGLTWSRARRILGIPNRWGQPAVIRSPGGSQLLMLLRENSRRHHSLFSVSDDQARTWSTPLELPAALTGDRHVARFAPDGRLIVAFRDVAKTSPTYGHYVAWVGRYEDIVARREGQYRIKLLHNAARSAEDPPGKGSVDCGYSDLEILRDGIVVATTYIKYRPGPEKNSVVTTRFQLAETDALLP